MPRISPDQPPLFAKAVAERDTRTAIRIARTDPSVHGLQLPTGYGHERALHAAVRLKSVGLARVLLEQGMDVDIPDSRGYTPLFLAPELYSRLSVVELLVECGADIHFHNDGALWSAIWQASYGYGNTLPMVHFLAKRGSTPRGLCHSAEAGNLKVARTVLAFGADVNEVDTDGHTPLCGLHSVAHAEAIYPIDF
ncbi:MAG: ankyrin repeat domain-containing protein [Pirellulaceae bacterium]|jgi:ankyrin repeat protein|nr:ankyrin repeat domain-containing protein [Pirellulaceae bacterium]MDP6721376.1 ankyrin repeat domain-containing protein [Pirellulaceae bacterium]